LPTFKSTEYILSCYKKAATHPSQFNLWSKYLCCFLPGCSRYTWPSKKVYNARVIDVYHFFEAMSEVRYWSSFTNP